MTKKILFVTSAFVAALCAFSYSQMPDPAPAPMTVQLSGSATMPVVVQQAVTSVKIEWILIEPDKEKITVKIQPFNKEFYIVGENYASIREALRPGLQSAILPIIMPQVNQYAADLNTQKANAQ